MICFRCGKNIGEGIGACENCRSGHAPDFANSALAGMDQTAKPASFVASYEGTYPWEKLQGSRSGYLLSVVAVVLVGLAIYIIPFVVSYECITLDEDLVEINAGLFGMHTHHLKSIQYRALSGYRLVGVQGYPSSIWAKDVDLPRLDVTYTSEFDYNRWLESTKGDESPTDSVKFDETTQKIFEKKGPLSILKFVKKLDTKTNPLEHLKDKATISLIAQSQDSINELVNLQSQFGDQFEVSGTLFSYQDGSSPELQEKYASQEFMLVDSLTLNGTERYIAPNTGPTP